VTENIEETTLWAPRRGHPRADGRVLLGEPRLGDSQGHDPEGQDGRLAEQGADRLPEVREKVAGRDVSKVELDPERALLVREAFRLYATGEYSVLELQATMRACVYRHDLADPDALASTEMVAAGVDNPSSSVVDGRWRPTDTGTSSTIASPKDLPTDGRP
jgi:hypothetical protein